jgi:hypothetical protein
MSFQARIKTNFGDLTILFDNENDLKDALENASKLAEIINEKAASLGILPETITGFEDISSIGSNGVPRLQKHPKKKSDTAKLVLFLASKPLDMNQWKEATGISNPLAYVNKGDLIKNPDGRYSLEASARIYVIEKVIPSLRKHD